MLENVRILYQLLSKKFQFSIENNILKALPPDNVNQEYKIFAKNFISTNKDFIISTIKSNPNTMNSGSLDILHFDLKHDSFYLSFSQERMLFIERYEKGTNAYNIPMFFRLYDHINISLLRNSINSLIDRHEVLRTIVKEDQGGTNYQCVLDSKDLLKVDIIDLDNRDELDQQLYKDSNCTFHLEKDIPIIIKLYRLNSEYYMSVVIHHIAFDGWSIDLLIKEIEHYYVLYSEKRNEQKSRLDLPELKIQYKDFAIWQKSFFIEEVLNIQMKYWMNKLDSYQLLYLPTDYSRPLQLDYQGNDVFLELEECTSRALKELAKKQKVSLFSVLLSAYYLMLSVYSNQNDIVIGTPVANRHYKGVENLIGFFTNSLAVRIEIDHTLLIKDFIKKVAQEIMEIQLYQDIPFEKVVDGLNTLRDTSRHPIFQVMFGIQKFKTIEKSVILKNYSLDSCKYNVAKFDISTFVDDSGNKLNILFNYAVSIYKKETISGFIKTYKRILDQFAELAYCESKQEHTEISDLNYLDDELYQEVIFGWNKTEKTYAITKTIHSLFEEQVQKTPANIACVSGNNKFTYDQINQKANQLANDLIKNYNIMPDTLVILCLDKNEQILISILAVLKAGGAYVPIDNDYPNERIEYIIKDTNSKIILTNTTHQKRLLGLANTTEILAIDEQLQRQASPQDIINPHTKTKSTNLAYVIYTSGTTGSPKGVMIEHNGVVNLVSAQAKEFGLSNLEEYKSGLLYSSIVFDAHVSELFTVILYGHTIHIINDNLRRDIGLLSKYIESNEIYIATLPPVLLRDTECCKLKVLVVAGDKVDQAILDFYLDNNDVNVINAYGPTEITVCATLNHYNHNGANNIGAPLNNKKCYVLSVNQKPVPIGGIGELYIGGEGVARGYLNREDLTAERFIHNPYQTNEEKLGCRNARLFRTGDLVKWLDSGELEYIGRNDSQVKIMGYRIETEEIQKHLLKHNIVSNCVVLEETNNSGMKSLIAYIVKTNTDKQSTNPRLWPSIAEYFVYDDLIYDILSNDNLRNYYYQIAINYLVKDKVVLDIGTGRDAILARFCVEAGAEKVFAIEYLKSSYETARSIIKKLNLQDRITLIYGDSMKITLPEKVDVVVSEIVGAIGSLEGAVTILNDARIRHLKNDGKMIPCKSDTCFAAVKYPEILLNECFHDVSMSYVQKIFKQIGHNFDVRVAIENFPVDHIISNTGIFESLDFNEIAFEEQEELVDLTILQNDTIDGFLLWLNLETFPGVFINTIEQKYCWIPIYFPVFEQSIKVCKGDRIQVKSKRSLSENNLNPDYFISGEIISKNGTKIPFSYSSKHFNEVYQGSSFYKNLFKNIENTRCQVKIDLQDILRKHLKLFLPEYMIPARFLTIDHIPLTINGKLNKNLLINSEFNSHNNYLAPSGELQFQLCQIWGEILGIPADNIGVNDNFFSLGGNSILAIRLVNKINTILHAGISISSIFNHNSVEKLSFHLKHNIKSYALIRKHNLNDVKKQSLSYAQERMWFIEKFSDGAVYNVPIIHKLMQGVNLDALVDSIKSIIKRHDILRTLIKEDYSGNVYQIVLEYQEILFSINKTTFNSILDLERCLHNNIYYIFDLSTECPIKVNLYELSTAYGQEIYLSIVIHHIAFDGWSAHVFINELVQYYNHYAIRNQLNLKELEIQYLDFAIWQRTYLNSNQLKSQLDYWLSKLSDFEPLNLLTDKTRTIQADYKGNDIYFEIDENTSYSLRGVAKEIGVSLYTVLLAGYYLMLRAYTNQDDLVIGVPMANRHYNQVEDLIGFFVNMVALRTKISDELSMEQYIKNISELIIEAQSNQDLPFEMLVRELGISSSDLNKNPLFQVIFDVQNLHGTVQYNDPRILFEQECQLKNTNYNVAKFDISCNLVDDSVGRLKGHFNYAVSLYESSSIQSFIDTYLIILSQLANLSNKQKQMKISDLSYINQRTLHRIIKIWNQTDGKFGEKETICSLFTKQVRKNASKIALISTGNRITYKELDKKANQLANYLINTFNITPNTLVALFLDRSEYTLIAMLAMLKTSGTYIPIDPNNPNDRIKYILEDTGSTIVLSNEIYNDRLRNINSSITNISIDSKALQSFLAISSMLPPQDMTRGCDLAYIIYTSGTTGLPKGVMIERRSLVNLILSMQKIYNIGKEDNFIFYRSYAFDGSIEETLLPLLVGGTISVCKDGLNDLKNILEIIEKDCTTVINLNSETAEVLGAHINPNNRHLKKIIAGGTKFQYRAFSYFTSNNIEIYNTYGPTECTVNTTALKVNSNINRSIGSPIYNATCYVLNKALLPLPIGGIGELYIGGEGVARGYLNREDLTAERFIHNPYQTNEEKLGGRNARLFRTGDLVKWLDSGELEYIGRNDFQVKIRGYRIELGEIESVLSSYKDIKQSVVIVKERSDSVSSKYLVGYYVSDTKLDEKEIISYLRNKLPEYMVPCMLMHLHTLPLTINGKLDRKLLPDSFIVDSDLISPRNEIEHSIRQIWSEILDLDSQKICVTVSFFGLGGNSILSLKLVSKINQCYQSLLKVSDIFLLKSIEQLANKVIHVKTGYQAITKLNDTNNKTNLFMIHTGGAGCEVYVSLANAISDEFCCYGVEPYNFYHDKKISNLNQLAKYYLSEIDKIMIQNDLDEYHLLGWSLGGLISLEIASILEARGNTKIKIYLLDTVLNDAYLSDCRINIDSKRIKELYHWSLSQKGHEHDYIEKAMSNMDIENIIGTQGISSTLQHTKIILFKAMLEDKRFDFYQYLISLKYNNIDMVMECNDHITLIKMQNVNHTNILSEEKFLSCKIIEFKNNLVTMG